MQIMTLVHCRAALLLVIAACAFVAAAGAQDTIKLHGAVYDAEGAVVVRATVTVTERSTGRVYSSATNDEGLYEFKLPVKLYRPSTGYRAASFDIKATAPHFEPTTVSNFKIVAAYTGSYRLDLA